MAGKKAFGFVRDCVEKYIPSIALAALFIIFCYQVFMRYVLRQPQAWAGEVEQSCFLWLVLLGACYAQRMKAHVTFTLLYDKLSIKGKAVVAMLGDIIIAFTAFCNILPSLHYVLGLAARHQVTTILKWPKTIVYFPYVVMIAILMPIPAGMIAACTLYFLTDGLIKGVGFGALITGAGGSLHLVAQKTIEAIFTNGTIVAVPLFIFAANVMNAGKITEYVFGTCMGLVGRFRGGLAHVNVLASLVFSGMTGSAIADASGLGKLEIDAMRKEGYDDGFSCAITAASATIGPIFPPSIPMVVYAMLTGASVGALFMAGMVPGVLLAVALCVYVYFVAKKRNYPRTAPPKLRDYLLYLTKSIWAMLTPVILLVGIYTGIMTPTEAGAIAGLYALLVSFLIYRLMSWRTLKQVLVDTMKGTGSVSIMIGAASAISFIFAKEQIGTILGNWLLSVTANKYVFLFAVNIIILILGCLVDTSVIQLVMIPILWPVAEAMGINIIHFGLIICFNMMVGLSTPPFGMCLFITSGISGTPLKDIIREIWWPIIVMLIVLAVITYIPNVVLFLPKLTGMMA